MEQIIVARNATRRQFNERYRQRLGRSGDPAVGDRVMFLVNAPDMDVFNGSVGEVTCLEGIDDNCWEITANLDEWHQARAIPTWDGPMHGLEAREGPRDYVPIDYAYAITCHKAQGSEYDSVLVYDEGFGDRETYRRWIYTAISRSKKRCVVVGAR